MTTHEHARNVILSTPGVNVISAEARRIVQALDNAGLLNIDTPTPLTRTERTLAILKPRATPNPEAPARVHTPAWGPFKPPLPQWIGTLGAHIWLTDETGWGRSLTTNQAENYAAALNAAVKTIRETRSQL